MKREGRQQEKQDILILLDDMESSWSVAYSFALSCIRFVGNNNIENPSVYQFVLLK
jgi:hypothetical protein